MFILYLIQHSPSEDIYIGFTDNLNARLKAHNDGKNKSTKRLSGEWILVYAEAYLSEQDARERERKLKQYGNAKQRLLKRISRSLEAKKRAG